MSVTKVALIVMYFDVLVLGICVFMLALKCDQLQQRNSDLLDENHHLRGKVYAYARLLPNK